MGEPSDTELVGQARRGQVAAAEALVRRYLRPAYAVALAVLRNAAEAEDVAQESLMVALQRLDQCRDPARFGPWLLRAVRNRSLNRLDQARVRGVFDGEAVRGEPQLADATRILVRQRLLAALEHLSATQREVVLLHDLEEWTHPEIAAALDVSEVMSRQHLFVARRILRDRLGSDPKEEPGHG